MRNKIVYTGKLNDSTLQPSAEADQHHKYRGSVRFAAGKILEYLVEKLENNYTK